MKMQVFSVYDKAVQAYLQPFFSRSKGEALRSFTEAVNDEKTQFHKHAADYMLVFIGEFEDSSGIFDTADPCRIISALECLADDPFTPETQVRSPLGRQLTS
jgi:hypothetical protein